jgi:cellulose synthase/poly-beta-1,6-N-acetylglucosamine synthase-like glycosyltransferase
MLVITILTSLVMAPLVVLTGFFAIETLLGLRQGLVAAPVGSDASVVIVVPAHNEAELIATTITDLRTECSGSARILVIADNCSDETTELAQKAGAEVLARNDNERRGKGYALAAARDHLRVDCPDVVIVVDADSHLDARSLAALTSEAIRTNRPAQAVYLFRPDTQAPPLVQISSFAFMIKNLVRQRGLQRLAGRAHLTGTGMAFPWQLFEQSSLGGSSIVEDLFVGLELAERGSAPLLVEQARVWSDPAPKGETLVQRSRWEGGYMATAIRIAPPLFTRSLRRLDLSGMIAAIDLSIPPLALLVLLNAALFALALGAFAAEGALWPAVVQLAFGLLALFAVILAWRKEGRPFASGTTLLRLPLYVIWKLPMYLRFAHRGAPKEWVRTAR